MTNKVKPITILVADDDRDDCMLIRDALHEGRVANDIRFVHDGQQLLDYLHRRGPYAQPGSAPRPGLILLDLNMPRKDGREALAEIKADPDLRQIPIIVLTTSKAEEDIYRSYDLGVNSYIAKPVTFSSLVELMRELGKYWLEIVELPPEDGPYGKPPISETTGHVVEAVALPEDRPIRILLVEDDPDDAFLLRKTLGEVKGLRFDVVLARRLRDALSHVDKGHLDVVLVDLSLPDSVGLDTFFRIHDRNPDLPVVVLTGLASEELAVRAVQAGAQDYLVKGQVTPQLLVRSLRYAMERLRTMRYRALLADHQRFDAAVSQMSDAIVVTDGKGAITTANRAACLLLNLPQDDWEGRSLWMALGAFTLSVPLTELMSSSEPVTALEIARPHTQPPLFLDGRLTRLFDASGNLISVVLMMRDVTDERYERHVQSNFLLMVSHKLRTPLAVMMAYLELARRLPQERWAQECPRVLEVFDQQARWLSDIVERLLDYKALSTGELEAGAARADLSAVLEGTMTRIRSRYPDLPIEFSLELPPDNPQIDAGAEDVAFILDKLLDNAAKFSDKQPVRIRVLVEHEQPGRLRISIADNGPGIPHEYYDKIFDGFVQVEDRVTGQVPGLGVGLHMARKVVQTYGGTISVKSTLGQGSTFTFTLPAVQTPVALEG